MIEHTLLAVQPLLVLLAAAGLILALGTEQSQIVAKTRGAFAGRIASGYMTAMQIMAVNRVGAILYVFSISLCIDTGISNRYLLLSALAGCASMLVYNLFLTINRRKVLSFSEERHFLNLLQYLLKSDLRYSIASFLATLCNVLALTLPFLLANSFPEYRLTLANTSFLLNAIFTLINVFVLEGRYAALIDNSSHHDAFIFVVRIFISRLIAISVALIIFTVLWLALKG